ACDDAARVPGQPGRCSIVRSAGRCPSGQREQTVNLPAYAFGGSNPPRPTTRPRSAYRGGLPGMRRTVNVEGLWRLPTFSHATVAGDHVYVSGALGTVGETGELATGGTGPETVQALRNIERILASCDTTLDDVVKVSVFLADMA